MTKEEINQYFSDVSLETGLNEERQPIIIHTPTNTYVLGIMKEDHVMMLFYGNITTIWRVDKDSDEEYKQAVLETHQDFVRQFRDMGVAVELG